MIRKKFQPDRVRFTIGIMVGLLGVYLLVLGTRLLLHAHGPIDGVLVLGGSIQRERYAIAHAPDLPRPILISGGSPSDCVQHMFDHYPVSSEGIWIEPCATSTFENFAFAAPFLENQGVNHVQVITSANHLWRAGQLGRIMLGFRGIAVEMFSVSERGRPGNHESAIKTTLDLLRGTLWGIFSPLLPAKICPGLGQISTIKSPPVPSRCQR